jgi:hypothetical protein
MIHDPIESIGIAFDDGQARALAKSFDDERLFSAGGKIEATIERSLVRMLSYKGSIKGWIVLIEKRGIDCIGKHWPVRS